MRNLKKILSLGVAVAMMLSVMVSAGAISYSELTDTDDISHQDEVAILVELGIVGGIEDTDGTYYYGPDNTVSRADGQVDLHDS